MTQIKIGLDVDGVLADVIHAWLAYSNKFRRPIVKEDISEWNFWEKHEINKYDFYSELSLCWKTWNMIPSTESNLSETTSLLAQIGKLDIVTAREESTHTYVRDWLSNQNITYVDYIGVQEGLEKTRLNYDIFIDDSPINVKSMLDEGKKVIIYNQPWNKKFDDPRAARIFELKDAIPIITTLFAA